MEVRGARRQLDGHCVVEGSRSSAASTGRGLLPAHLEETDFASPGLSLGYACGAPPGRGRRAGASWMCSGQGKATVTG